VNTRDSFFANFRAYGRVDMNAMLNNHCQLTQNPQLILLMGNSSVVARNSTRLTLAVEIVVEFFAETC
jgi:hypothetical protein